MPTFKSETGDLTITTPSFIEGTRKKDRRRKIVVDGVTYRRVPKPKKLSRAKRLQAAVERLESVHCEMEEIASKTLTAFEELDDILETSCSACDVKHSVGEWVESRVDDGRKWLCPACNVTSDDSDDLFKMKQHIDNLISEFQNAALSADMSEIDELYEEIESWMDSLSGTNLENSEKYSQLEECLQQIDDGRQVIESLETDSIEDYDDIDNIVSEFSDALIDLGAIEFPGMY